MIFLSFPLGDHSHPHFCTVMYCCLMDRIGYGSSPLVDFSRNKSFPIRLNWPCEPPPLYLYFTILVTCAEGLFVSTSRPTIGLVNAFLNACCTATSNSLASSKRSRSYNAVQSEPTKRHPQTSIQKPHLDLRMGR